MIQSEMVGWLHRLNGHKFEQTLQDTEMIGKPGVLQFMGLSSLVQIN